jgi:prepilin-type N-terminal cleavage/methylation domain-containing protein
MHNDNTRLQAEAGFSLLEMVVAVNVLAIGLLAVAAAIGYALMASNSGRALTNSKLLVVTALEQMQTLRDAGQLTFDEISNTHVNGSSFSGFPPDFRPVTDDPGPDGVFGTLDDLMSPGPNGAYGDADDVSDQARARPGVTRQILITSLSPTLKKIQVTLNYSPNGGTSRQMVAVIYLNDDSRGNYTP